LGQTLSSLSALTYKTIDLEQRTGRRRLFVEQDNIDDELFSLHYLADE